MGHKSWSQLIFVFSFIKSQRFLMQFLQQCVYEIKIHDVDDLRKHLMQIWFDFDQDINNATIDQWLDRLSLCVHAGGGNFEHML